MKRWKKSEVRLIFLIFASLAILSATFFAWVTWSTLIHENAQLQRQKSANTSMVHSSWSVDACSKQSVPCSPEISRGTHDDGLVSSSAIDSSANPANELTEPVSELQEIPFLYEIKQDRIAQLSPDQQDSLLRVHEQFIEFYQTNPSAFYDQSLRDQTVRNLRERAVNAIGVDNFEALLR
jgi:hypothetical protein